MKYLALVVLLCALLPLSSAFCYRKLITPDMTHCQDESDNTWHEVGSKWRNNRCMDCTCEECCSAYSTPMHFPEDCVSVFDEKKCEYIVHKKNNPAVRCPVFAEIGK